MKIIKSIFALIPLLIFMGCSGGPAENIKLPTLFSDNMVLQRDMPVPVWGTADAGGGIEVRINGQVKKTSAEEDGKWRVMLDKMEAGGPFTIQIIGRDTLTFKNVMIGEVWLASGQSNMEMAVRSVKNAEEEIAAADYPDIRLFQVKKTLSLAPLDTVNCPGWALCTPQTVPGFSAAAYFFARKLYKELKVPVGIIHSSWGGSVAQAWTSAEALRTMPDFAEAVDRVIKARGEQQMSMKEYKRILEERFEKVRAGNAGYKDGKPVWNAVDLDDSDWHKINNPTRWETAGYPDLDGIMWYRKSVNIPSSMAKSDLILSLDLINDNDITWFNGVEVGRTNGADKARKYKIPASIVKAGKNVIAVSVQDIGYSGGLWGKKSKLYIEGRGGKKISLSGEWLCKPGFDEIKMLGPKPDSPIDHNRPTVLYNGMINPLIPYAIRGAIWYQGEGNTGSAYQYRTLFPLMIKDWRARWKEGDFPFLFVQLANFKEKQTEPQDDDWAELREAQLMTLSLPNTGMAVIIDIGEADDIHPKNKQEVGRRLALNALARVYGKDVVYSGPIYKSMKVEGNKIRLFFDHVDGGLMFKNGKTLQGFAIAGKDKKFVWGKAKIDGETVVVSAKGIKYPVAVRYAWAANPIGNLFNRAGLPASPFRTDSWKGITQR